MMYILFSDKKGFRQHDDQIKMFTKVFSGVNKWLELSHQVIGKRDTILQIDEIIKVRKKALKIN